MASDPLSTLIKVRKRACEEAQRALVEALEMEDRAEQASQRFERKIALETEAATDLHGSDALVEAFAAWLPMARHELAHSRQLLLDRQAETMRKRAELTASRTALETVELLLQQRQDAKRKAVELLYARDLEDRPYGSNKFEEKESGPD